MASSSKANQVNGYLKPKFKQLVTAYVADKAVTQSEVVNTAVENFFNSMSTAERLRLLQKVQHNQGSPNNP